MSHVHAPRLKYMLRTMKTFRGFPNFEQLIRTNTHLAAPFINPLKLLSSRPGTVANCSLPALVGKSISAASPAAR